MTRTPSGEPDRRHGCGDAEDRASAGGRTTCRRDHHHGARRDGRAQPVDTRAHPPGQHRDNAERRREVQRPRRIDQWSRGDTQPDRPDPTDPQRSCGTEVVRATEVGRRRAGDLVGDDGDDRLDHEVRRQDAEPPRLVAEPRCERGAVHGVPRGEHEDGAEDDERACTAADQLDRAQLRRPGEEQRTGRQSREVVDGRCGDCHTDGQGEGREADHERSHLA
jgi:hypothetical protein